MSGIRPRQMARMGQFHLEEAVCDVLLESRHEGECIGAAEISRRAGIFRDSGGGDPIKSFNDAIVTGLLIKLYHEGKVEQCNQPGGRGGWQLTEDEFNRRRDDVALEPPE